MSSPTRFLALFLLMAGCKIFAPVPGPEDSDAADADTADMADTDASPDVGDADRADADAAVEPGCGNGIIDEGEECDGDAVSSSCWDEGFDGGSLTCTAGCTLDPSACYTCDYYVDPERGDDSNDGMTDETAFASVAAVDALLEAPAQVIDGGRFCFRRGTSHNAPRIDIDVGGTSVNPLVFSSYGDSDEPRPILDFGDLVDPSGWESMGGNLYRRSGITGEVASVWVSETYLSGASDTTVSDGGFFLDGSELYVRSPNGAPLSDHDVRLVRDGNFFEIGEAADGGITDYMEFDGLHIRWVQQAMSFHAHVADARHIRVENCTFTHAQDTIRIYNDVPGATEDYVIRDNRFENVSKAVEARRSTGDGRIRGFVFEGNVTRGRFGREREEAAIQIHACQACQIVDNVFDYGSDDPEQSGAILLDSTVTAAIRDVEIARNLFIGGDRALTVWGGDNPVSKMKFHHNIVIGGRQGVRFDGVGISGTEIAHNTFHGQEVAAIQLPQEGVGSIQNNIFSGQGGVYMSVVPVALSTAIDHNLYAPADSAFEYDGSPMSISLWKQDLDQDTNSEFVADPGFVGEQLEQPDAFQLTPLSSAIELGIDLGYTTDFGGRSIDTDMVDVGAWQFEADR